MDRNSAFKIAHCQYLDVQHSLQVPTQLGPYAWLSRFLAGER